MKKNKILVFALSLVLVGSFILTSENLIRAEENPTVKDGVYINGLEVSGMDEETLREEVENYFEDLKGKKIVLVGPKGNLTLSLKSMGASADIEAAIDEAMSVGQSGNLIKRFKEIQGLKEENYVVDLGLTIDKELTAETMYNKSSQIDIKAIDNGLKIEGGEFVYVPGQDGDEVDIVTSVNELAAYVENDWKTEPKDGVEFVLTSIVSHPRGTEEELSVVKDKLGSFTTNYKSSGWGRAKNVENGTKRIHGTVLYPGDELSFYEMVNPFTKENGYELAGSYLNGETVESFGGGICQVSTTLYNAVLNAELEITQRFNHSMTVAYVDLSADAAIAGTYKDLRFKNQYDFPVYIEGICKNRNITFNIYGVETRPNNRKVTYVSEVISVNDPPTEYAVLETVPVGTYQQTRSKHVGYVAQLWKVVKVDGVEQEKTKVNKSTYNASARKVTIGIGGANPAQIAAVQAAIATGNDEYVQHVVSTLGGIY